MVNTVAIVGVAIIAVVGLIFWDELTSGFESAISTQQEKDEANAFNFTPEETTPICDLAINIKGELEHHFLGTLAQGGIADLDFEFGEDTFFPQVAEWQFINCQGSFQVASFLPRLATNIEIVQQGGVINKDTSLTTNQLTSLDVTELQSLSLSGNEEQVEEQLSNLNISVDDLQTNDLIALWDEVYDMEIKIIEKGNSAKFRECGTFNQNLCKQLVWKAGIIEEPATFSKTFLITDLPLEEYIVEITIVNQRINEMPPNVPYIYNVSFN